MRIFMFSSQMKPDLHAFAGDEAGTRLPEKFAPWGLTGAIGPRAAPPHKFARQTIEQAIAKEGFQLWRIRQKAEESSDSEKVSNLNKRPGRER